LDVIGRGLLEVLSHYYTVGMCKYSLVLFVSGDKQVSKKEFIWQTVSLWHNA